MEDGEVFPEEVRGEGMASPPGRGGVLVGRTRGGTGHPFGKAGEKEKARQLYRRLQAWWGGEAVLGRGSSFVTEKGGYVCAWGGEVGLGREGGVKKLPWGVRTRT